MNDKLKLISMFILGFICAGTTAYALVLIDSREIQYDNSISGMTSTNVQDAIEELHTKTIFGDATSEDILQGKTALVNGEEITGSLTLSNTNSGTVYYLGTGTSFNVASKLPNDYKNLTANNFIVGAKSTSSTTGTRTTGNEHKYLSGKFNGFNISKSYNATTGVLTVSGVGSSAVFCNDDSYIYCSDLTLSSTATVFAYVVVGSIN